MKSYLIFIFEVLSEVLSSLSESTGPIFTVQTACDWACKMCPAKPDFVDIGVTNDVTGHVIMGNDVTGQVIMRNIDI